MLEKRSKKEAEDFFSHFILFGLFFCRFDFSGSFVEELFVFEGRIRTGHDEGKLLLKCSEEDEEDKSRPLSLFI